MGVSSGADADCAGRAVEKRQVTSLQVSPVFCHTVAQVRAVEDRATLFLVADSGPLYRFGEVQVTGLDHVDAESVRALQTFSTGQPLREQALLDYQDRLV